MTKKKEKTMNEVSKNYEAFIKHKKVGDNAKRAFDNTIRKAVTTKQRGSK